MASLTELFAVPPKEFTAARKALVKKLRASGHEAEARRAAALRRPTAALWVVNQLARVARDDVDALVDAAAQLRRAYANGSGESLREAMSAQHAAVAAIAKAAAKAAKELGAKPSADLLRRVQDTAQTAAATDPDALRAGSLETELAPAGFDALAGAKVATPRRSRPSNVSKSAPKKAQKPPRTARAASKAARVEEQRRKRELRAAEREVDRLRHLAERSEASADRARAAADDAQARLRDAEERALALRGRR